MLHCLCLCLCCELCLSLFVRLEVVSLTLVLTIFAYPCCLPLTALLARSLRCCLLPCCAAAYYPAACCPGEAPRSWCRVSLRKGLRATFHAQLSPQDSSPPTHNNADKISTSRFKLNPLLSLNLDTSLKSRHCNVHELFCVGLCCI